MGKLNADCIVFDLDGTLIDSAKGIHRCVTEVLAKRGYRSFNEKFLSKSIGVHPIDAIFQRTVKKREVEACVKEFKQRYARTLTQDVILLDGAKETLDALGEDGYKISVYRTYLNTSLMRIRIHPIRMNPMNAHASLSYLVSILLKDLIQLKNLSTV